ELPVRFCVGDGHDLTDAAEDPSGRAIPDLQRASVVALIPTGEVTGLGPRFVRGVGSDEEHVLVHLEPVLGAVGELQVHDGVCRIPGHRSPLGVWAATLAPLITSAAGLSCVADP